MSSLSGEYGPMSLKPKETASSSNQDQLQSLSKIIHLHLQIFDGWVMGLILWYFPHFPLVTANTVAYNEPVLIYKKWNRRGREQKKFVKKKKKHVQEKLDILGNTDTESKDTAH